jgi:hypothetical protein
MTDDPQPEYLSRIDIGALPDGTVLVTETRGEGDVTDVRAARVHLPTMHVDHLEDGADGRPLPKEMILHAVAVSLPVDHGSLPDALLEAYTVDTETETDTTLEEAMGEETTDESPLTSEKGPVVAMEDELEKHGYDIGMLEKDAGTIHFDVFHDSFEKVKALGGGGSVAGYNGQNNVVAVEDVPELLDEIREA